MADRGICACGAELPMGSKSGRCPACEVESILDDAFFAESEFPEIEGLEISKLIGEGGMGRVYRAEKLDPPRLMVAVKVIKGSLGQADLFRRFQTEIEALARLDHPGICRILDAGQTRRAEPYYVMEFIEGLPLSDYLRQGGDALSREEKLELAIALCSAVQACHSAAVVHRDLSPRNILVTKNGEPRLLDFGIAKLLADEGEGQITRTLISMGTPGFMAPEQVRVEGRIETATDVFVLGIWLARIFAGEFPFDSEVEAVLHDEAILPKKLVNGDLRAVIHKALRKEASQRYRSAGELENDLRRVAAREPVAARPLTTLYFFQTWLRRYRGRVLAAAAMIAVLALGGIYSWRGRLEAEREIEKVRLEKLTDDLVLTAEAKGVQGNWEDTLRDLELALARGHREPERVRLLMVEAALAAGNRERAEAEFGKVVEESALRNYWAAFFADTEEEALELLERSLEGELPAEKALVSRSLITESPKERISLLKEALEFRAYDHQALSFLVLNQIFTSQVEDACERLRSAKYLFPNDENLTVLLVMGEWWQGNQEEAERLVDELNEGGTSVTREDLELMTPGEIQGTMLYEAFWYPEKKWALAKAFQDEALASPLAKRVDGLELSPLAERIIQASFPDLEGLFSFLLGGATLERSESLLKEEMAQDYPHDVVMFIAIMSYFSHFGGELEDRKVARLIDEACLTGLASTRNAGLRAFFLEIAAVTRYVQANAFDSQEHGEAAREYTVRRLAISQPIASVAADFLLNGTFKQKQINLHSRILTRIGLEMPDDPVYLSHLAKTKEARGHFFAALEALRKIPGREEDVERVLGRIREGE